jgi:hypothetical protein
VKLLKENKLPVMSNEERKKIWQNLNTDNILVHIETNYFGDSYNIRQYKVVKRTPKGYIRLDNGELLKEFYSCYHVVTDELKDWFEKVKLEEDVWKMIHLDIPRNKREFKNNLSYEDAKLLQDIFERTLPQENTEF